MRCRLEVSSADSSKKTTGAGRHSLLGKRALIKQKPIVGDLNSAGEGSDTLLTGGLTDKKSSLLGCFFREFGRHERI